jgi:ATP-dependent DNA helicase RecQ
LLKGHSKADVRDWAYQLIGQGALLQVGDEYPVLRLNDASWEVMRGQRQVRLVQLVRRKKGERPEKTKIEAVSWEGVDRELFEAFRRLRRDLARDRKVSAFIVFEDRTLRELARMRPSTLERMRLVPGVGEKRLRDYGSLFLTLITDHCRTHGLAFDIPPTGRKS